MTATSLSDLALTALAVLPIATVVGLVTMATLIWIVVRCLGIGVQAGHFPVHSRQAWQAWATLRALDEARTWLFPLYASTLTPAWFRTMGARIGSDVEISTALMIPRLTTINDGAFLADDTLIGGYELGGGWLRIDRAKIGKRAFVGNSGMTAPGRKVPKGGLVAVLSAAPRRTKAKAGTSWLGSPPAEAAPTSGNGDSSRTYLPDARAPDRPSAGRVLPVVAGDGGNRTRRLGRRGTARPRHQWFLVAGWVAQRPRDGRCRSHRGTDRGGCEVGPHRSTQAAQQPTLELLHLAQRARRHVRGADRGALVRPAGNRHTGSQRLAAIDGRQDRARCLV